MHCIRKQRIVSYTLRYGCSRCSLAWLPLFLWRRSELALECFVTDQTGTARLSTRTRTALKLNINERLPIPKNSPCCFIAVIKSAVLTRQLRTCSDWDWQSINPRVAAATAVGLFQRNQQSDVLCTEQPLIMKLSDFCVENCHSAYKRGRWNLLKYP